MTACKVFCLMIWHHIWFWIMKMIAENFPLVSREMKVGSPVHYYSLKEKIILLVSRAMKVGSLVHYYSLNLKEAFGIYHRSSMKDDTILTFVVSNLTFVISRPTPENAYSQLRSHGINVFSMVMWCLCTPSFSAICLWSLASPFASICESFWVILPKRKWVMHGGMWSSWLRFWSWIICWNLIGLKCNFPFS